MIWDVGDANPLHRRIPGEIVSRRKYLVKKIVAETEPEEVEVDLKIAVALKPEQRLKWLTKACAQVKEGQASSTDLYDIVVNRKFVAGMPERVVRKISVVVEEALEMFSDKQQRYLSSNESPVLARLVAREPAELPDDHEESIRSKMAIERDSDGLLDSIQQKVRDSIRKGFGGPRPQELEVSSGAAFPTSGAARPTSKSSILPPGAGERDPPGDSGKTSGGGSSADGGWSSVKDEWTMRRQEAEAKEQAKREATRRAEKKASILAEEEAARRSAEAAEAERRRKLEEEADALFSQAVAPGSALALVEAKEKRNRSLSRSRSISSRTARRMARQNKIDRGPKPMHWKKEASHGRSQELSGSRAIFMNRDFVEDLPHMPRPMTPGVQGVGGIDKRRISPEKEKPERPALRDRSRSRDRRRRRER